MEKNMKKMKKSRTGENSNTVSEPVESAATDSASTSKPAIAEQRKSAATEVRQSIESRVPETSFLASMRLPINYAALTTVRKVLTTIPIRKPLPQSFFRVRPGNEWRDAFAVIEDKEHGETHIVLPNLAEKLASEARFKQFYTYVTRDGSVGIWPINLPGADGRLDAWSQSAHRAAELAENKWIRLQSNRQLGAYDVIEALGIGDEPKWPDESFDKLLKIACRDRVIDTFDHPMIRRLRGDV
jgi:hypothetical protein